MLQDNCGVNVKCKEFRQFYLAGSLRKLYVVVVSAFKVTNGKDFRVSAGVAGSG